MQIEARVKDKTPYVVVALQEAARMNTLLSEMRQSMDELLLGLGGSLNMSDKMEKLAVGKIGLDVAVCFAYTDSCCWQPVSQSIASLSLTMQELLPTPCRPCGWLKYPPDIRRC